MGVAGSIETKAGPSTIFESIHRELPMVLDASTRLIRWEEMNISFVEEHGLGTVNRKAKELSHIISQHLFDDAYRTRVQNKFETFEKRSFREEFKELASEILAA